MKRNLLLLALACLGLIGCQDAKTGVTTSGPTSSGSTPPTGTTGATGAAEPATRPSPEAVPQELKHLGYEYYGLGNNKTMDMEVSISEPAKVITGAQTTVLKEIKDGKPIYAIERTGGLTGLGEQTVRLEKDGIYLNSSSVATVGGKDVEMPSNPKMGDTWQNVTKVENGGTTMNVTSTVKVGGIEKVQTKAGSREGLLISASGSGTMQNEKVKMSSKTWYVKGVGAVKSVLTTTYPGGRVQTLTIQETK